MAASREDLETLLTLRDDFPIYARQALKIKNKTGDLVPFELNKAQQVLHEAIERQRAETGIVRVLALKGRQQGVSTYVEGRFYHKTSMREGQAAFILTHEDKATQNLFSMAKRYHDNVPAHMRPHTKVDNANELIFDILGSKYGIGTAKTKGVGRSFTVQLFHGSEVAFWDNAKTHLAGIGQAIPDLPGTEIIFESTANGIGNMFYNKVQDAIRGIGDYILVFIPWFWQPEYQSPVPANFELTKDELIYKKLYNLSYEQMAWRAKKIINDFSGDVTLFDQEYPASPALAFMANTKDSYLPLDLINVAMSNDLPVSNTAPVILGLDPAEYGEDATAWALRIGRKVMWVKRKYKKGTMEVVGITGIIVEEIKKKYGRIDSINVDCTGIGSGVADRLLEQGYPVQRIHFGGGAFEDEVYHRQKDEMYGNCKKWLENEPNQLPKDDVLLADMIGPKYSYNSSRCLLIESKEKMHKRGLKSPDSADAVALTFAIQIVETGVNASDLKVSGFRAGTG